MSIPESLPPSIVRTVVPIVVGVLVAVLPAELGITSDQLTPAVTAAVTGTGAVAYYLIARALEVYVNPRLGWLLGSDRSPEYQPRHRAGDEPAAAPATGAIDGVLDHRADPPQ